MRVGGGGVGAARESGPREDARDDLPQIPVRMVLQDMVRTTQAFGAIASGRPFTERAGGTGPKVERPVGRMSLARACGLLSSPMTAAGREILFKAEPPASFPARRQKGEPKSGLDRHVRPAHGG
jgi:hypothetical protein